MKTNTKHNTNKVAENNAATKIDKLSSTDMAIAIESLPKREYYTSVLHIHFFDMRKWNGRIILEIKKPGTQHYEYLYFEEFITSMSQLAATL